MRQLSYDFVVTTEIHFIRRLYRSNNHEPIFDRNEILRLFPTFFVQFLTCRKRDRGTLEYF